MRVKASKFREILNEEISQYERPALQEISELFYVPTLDFSVLNDEEFLATAKNAYFLKDGLKALVSEHAGLVIEGKLGDNLLQEMWLTGNKLEGAMAVLADFLRTNSGQLAKALAKADSVGDRRVHDINKLADKLRYTLRDIAFSASKPDYEERVDTSSGVSPTQLYRSRGAAAATAPTPVDLDLTDPRTLRDKEDEEWARRQMKGIKGWRESWKEASPFYDQGKRQKRAQKGMGRFSRYDQHNPGVDPDAPSTDDEWLRDVQKSHKGLKRGWRNTVKDMFGF